MAGNLQPDQGQRKPRSFPAKAKSKFGCRTCKIRRVKCDESRPVCDRCSSTGRKCDGYGIWGGASKDPSSKIHCSRDKPPCISNDTHWSLSKPIYTTFSLINPDEQLYLDWFVHRSTTKLPGLFVQVFWNTLLLQICSTEPAVLHAVLALSSAHRRDALFDGIYPRRKVHDEHMKFMLYQYSEAIRHLQAHFSTKEDESIRIALVTCLLFIYFSFLRGHYHEGCTHLESGLKLLGEIQTSLSASSNVISTPTSCIDDCIIELFRRLYLQAKLLGQALQAPTQQLEPFEFESTHATPVFRSINQARNRLERILCETVELSDQCRHPFMTPALPPFEERQIKSRCSSASKFEELTKQRRIQADLDSWLESHKSTLQTELCPRDKFAYSSLRVHQIMAEIMADVSVQPTYQTRFDNHTEAFLSIINLSIGQYKAIFSSDTRDKLLGLHHGPDMSASVIDGGWIPPLYYTALKCRVHRIRLQAVQLLRIHLHKEGIWDAEIAACVAEEVVRLEEQDFCWDASNYDLNPLNWPAQQDLDVTPLPESHRLHDVEVRLPEDPSAKIILTCRRRSEDSNRDIVVRREHHLSTRRWIDVAG